MKWLSPAFPFLLGVAFTLTIVGFTKTHHNSEGYFIEHEKEIAVQQPGPHNGGGQTTAYSFFSNIATCS